jgi:RNA polymerase sigma-70 factor (ECF subfamily)
VFGRAGQSRPGRIVPFDADRPLVEAARSDPRLFEPLYRKYVAQVYSFALYEVRDRHAAEDATEQVFLRALNGLPRFEERGDGDASTFRVWLFRIARNVVANERRRRRRRPEYPLELAEDVAAPDDPAAVAASRALNSVVWSAIDRLPDDRRRALMLRFVEEMTTPEIASVLARSEGAVRVLIHRGLRQVAREVRRADRASN